MERILLLLLFLIFNLGIPFLNTHNSDSELIRSLSLMYAEYLELCDSEIKKLSNGARDYKAGLISIEDLRNQLSITRLAYKDVELYMEYFQREAVSKYINGAPLPKLETSAPGINVIEPSGLQTLDEIIYDESAMDMKSEIYDLASKLDQFWTQLYIIENKKKLQHRFVFEASRFQILRIYTLGLTGFDTPGSVAAIPESVVALGSIRRYIEMYESFSIKYGQQRLWQHIVDKLLGFENYLKEHNDFDRLDRMFVLREYVNPIYSGIYDLQKGLSIEYSEEVDPTPKAVNYHASLPFSNDFLNKAYYAQISNEELENEDRIRLGEILFFDPILSNDLSMSCASCHAPEKAFTDGLKKSNSNVDGYSTLRNSPTLINSVYAERYFYDLREYSLERQVKHVVYDDKEFNMDFVDLADRLKQSEEYLQLFKDCYGEQDKYGISTWSISNALAAYVASLSSWDSEFDKYARGETDILDEDVIAGYNLFMGKAACGTCHFAPSFNGTIPPNYLESESEVLGVPIESDTINARIDPDPGRINSGRAIDEAEHFLHAFKTTTVRNSELTAPYMHNGVYEKLDEVLDFYNRGGGAGIGIDLKNQTLPGDPLGLTDRELKQIKSFLHSLTDTSQMTKRNSQLPLFGIDEFDRRKVIDY